MNQPMPPLKITKTESRPFRTLSYGILLGLFSMLVSMLPDHASAQVPVSRHDLRCDENFPCHDDIRGRTDFWVQVYSKWTTNQGVFHDSLHPERVYAVIDVPDGCRGDSGVVDRERARIKEQLLRLARATESGARVSDAGERAMLELFPNRSAKSIREAAERVRCQQGNRDRFEGALKRYGAYGPVVKKLINESGLPDDVHLLPFVESLYNPKAYSRVGAAGLWQIMPKTARYLGLELDATVDERLDVESATIGAIRYLEDSRKRLTAVAREKDPSIRDGELGPFIITSYNYGVSGMRRAIQELGPDFMSVINNYRSPSFQVAVKNFYASFLAARYVAKNSEKYFGKVATDPVLRYHTVVLNHDTSMQRIIDVFGVEESELRELNGALTRFVWHGWRLAPKGYRLRLPYRDHAWSRQVARLDSLGPESDSRGPVNYTVRKGDTACGIARAFHVNCKDLIDMNSLGQRATIRIGQSLVIPGKRGTGGSATRLASAPVSDGARPQGTYRVKPGDSPCGIADRVGVPCAVFMSRNGLDKRSLIHPGQQLHVPGSEVPAPSTESTATVVTTSKVPARYTVKANDTACEIAERFSLPCASLLTRNGLSTASILKVGQVLELTDAESSSGELGPVEGQPQLRDVAYTVQPGDTLCQVAERFNMACAGFLYINNLNNRSVIYVGQTLKVRQPATHAISGETAEEIVAADVPSGTEVVQDTAGEAASSPLDSAVPLGIDTRANGSAFEHFIVVESDETLGHYADWLGIGSVAPIKTLNEMGVNEQISIGRQLRLPVSTDGQKQDFERKRSDYHRVLIEEFKENYTVQKVENYQVLPGDSAWKVAGKFQLPLWVLTRYNPELRSRRPFTGEMLKVPTIESRS